MPKFADRRSGRATPDESSADQGIVSRISSFKRDESALASDGSSVSPDYTQLGEHVGVVLEAAKDAAARMKHEALEDAERIRAEADETATTAVADARKQAKQIEAAAAQLETTARESADRIRGEADAYAGTTRRAAEAEADAILDRAKQHASERIRETEAHLQSLGDQVASTEQRLRQLVDRLRDLASSLDDLVAGPNLAVQAGGARDEDDERTSLAETLTESVSGRRAAPQAKTHSKGNV